MAEPTISQNYSVPNTIGSTVAYNNIGTSLTLVLSEDSGRSSFFFQNPNTDVDILVCQANDVTGSAISPSFSAPGGGIVLAPGDFIKVESEAASAPWMALARSGSNNGLTIVLRTGVQFSGGLGSGVPLGGPFLRAGDNLADIQDKEEARQNLGVEIGVDVQAHSADLDKITSGGSTNQVPRSTGGASPSFDWVSVLYKTQQGSGQLDIGATYSVMAHTGPGNSLGGGLWFSRDTDPPQAGVNGFTDSGIATYQGVGSVSLYVDIAGPPPVATLPGTFTATTWVPSSALSGAVLAKMFVGQYLLVQGTNYWGKVTEFTSTVVTVSGWYQNGNTSPGQVPAGTQNVIIGVVTKVWANNSNALLGPSSYADQAIGFELGAGNYKGSYDLATGTGPQVNGLNVASLGPFNNHWAVLVTRQTGDGTWARGVYVAGTTFSAFTAGSWAGDTQAPEYGFQYNWTTGKAFAINGSIGGGAERYYVDGAGNMFTQANVGLGFAPTANNRLIAQGYGTAGATNSIVGKNSTGATTFTVRDNGLVIMGAFTVANLPSSGVSAGSEAYATNGRRGGQGVGAGTGVKVFYDSSGNWIACDTGQAVAA